MTSNEKQKIFKMTIPGCPVSVYIGCGMKSVKMLSSSAQPRLWWSEPHFNLQMRTIQRTPPALRQKVWREQWKQRARELQILESIQKEHPES